MSAYYNEIDPFAVEWLKKLIEKGHIAPGDVDNRSIADVQADDLKKYDQCHFFAGIGVWSYALKQAGIADNTSVWTGSCPCQPFSSAGNGKGTADERHLWPQLYRLVAKCRPPRVLSEQVAGKGGASWFDLVQADLAQEEYAAGLVVFPACGIGAPHQRQRLYWVGENTLGNSNSLLRGRIADDQSNGEIVATGSNAGSVDRAVCSGSLADTVRPNATNGYWSDPDWLYCRDDKWRPVRPRSFPLVDGSANRVGRLRGYGNAIVAPQAQAFIEAVFEI